MHVACLCACVHETGWFQHPWGTLPMGTAPLKFTIALLTSPGLWSLIYVVQGPSPTPPLPACRRAPPLGCHAAPHPAPISRQGLGRAGSPLLVYNQLTGSSYEAFTPRESARTLRRTVSEVTK